MNRPFARGLVAALLCSLGAVASARAWELDHEDYEEPAGASFAFLLNPADDIYGISLGSGVWLRDTPVFGDYFIRLFHSGIENMAYSGLGMTFRLMPHTRFAPFIGAGGSYNYALTQSTEPDSIDVAQSRPDEPADARVPVDQGESFWGGHAEAGARLWLSNRVGLLEVFGRFTWTSFDAGDRDFWLIGISTGIGF